MQKHIIGENEISYTLGEHGLYYPDLSIPEGTHYDIGRYGRMRAKYLEEYKHAYYIQLILEAKLNEHLHQVDEECHERMDLLMEQMKKKWNVTEELKSKDQMLWVGKMNSIHHSAEEMVLSEMIFV